MEALSGVKGDNSVKIFGPDLDKLEELADEGARTSCKTVRGIENVGVFHIKGQTQPGVPRRSGEVQEVGRHGGRRQQRRQHGPGRQGPCPR